jgi:hypothetical protein
MDACGHERESIPIGANSGAGSDSCCPVERHGRATACCAFRKRTANESETMIPWPRSILAASFDGIPVIVDRWLPAGKWRFFDGRLYVGEGTNMQEVLFEMNLNPEDRELLAALKVKP